MKYYILIGAIVVYASMVGLFIRAQLRRRKERKRILDGIRARARDRRVGLQEHSQG
jgi:hypothetical protein